MADVFDRLVARSAQPGARLTTRHPARFEHGAGVPAPDLSPGEVAGPAEDPGPRAPSPRTPAHDVVGARGEVRPEPAPAGRSGRAVPAVPPPEPERRDGPAAGTPPGPTPAPPAPAGTRPEGASLHAAVHEPAVAAGLPVVAPAADPRVVATPGNPRSTDSSGPGPAVALPPSGEDDRPLPATRTEPVPRVVPAGDLLAEHVAPALVAAGALSEREAMRLVAVPGDAPRLPRRRQDGRVPVRVDDVRATGEVHVHIEVHREPQPAAPPPPAVPPKVDHTAYLEKQAGRWRA